MKNMANGRADHLRDDIDKGRKGDKVPFPDPAAAPLGTDDEAAGAPPLRASVPSQDNAGEIRAPAVTHEASRGFDDNRGGNSRLAFVPRVMLWLGAIAALCALGAAMLTNV